MSAMLKQKLIDIANGFTKYGLWKGAGSSALSEMTDVTFTDLQVNDVLKYNGSVWINDDNLQKQIDTLNSNFDKTMIILTYETTSTFSNADELHTVIQEAISACKNDLKQYQYNSIFIGSGTANFSVLFFYANNNYYSGIANGYSGIIRGMYGFTKVSCSKLF